MNAQQVWQAQMTDAPRMSLTYVRHVVSEFERSRRRRAVRFFVLAVVACGINVAMALKYFAIRPLGSAGSLCLMLCMLFWVFRLRRHLTSEPNPVDAGTLDTLRYQRRLLERLRDWRRNLWRWLIPAFLPGFALKFASEFFEVRPERWMLIGFLVLGLTFISVMLIVGGEHAARRVQREIDALDSLAGDR